MGKQLDDLMQRFGWTEEEAKGHLKKIWEIVDKHYDSKEMHRELLNAGYYITQHFEFWIRRYTPNPREVKEIRTIYPKTQPEAL